VADEYQLWRCRPLTERYVYLFADGLYLKAGLEGEKTAVLIVIGVTADGRKELLATPPSKLTRIPGSRSLAI
jgi:transposase-like protein